MNENLEVGICELLCPLPNIGTIRPLLVVGETNVLIHCNLISPQFVGDSTARCLRTFIFQSTDCQHTFREVFLCTSGREEFARHSDRVFDTGGQASHL